MNKQIQRALHQTKRSKQAAPESVPQLPAPAAAMTPRELYHQTMQSHELTMA